MHSDPNDYMSNARVTMQEMRSQKGLLYIQVLVWVIIIQIVCRVGVIQDCPGSPRLRWFA